ncbi:hypothetical protein JOD44_002772 [Salimicrobium jeotgali]|nr:hypothetical protein [Salimicrobium jeotgali]
MQKISEEGDENGVINAVVELSCHTRKKEVSNSN